MALDLPPFLRKKLTQAGADVPPESGEVDEEGNPLGEESASDSPEMKGTKVNPLKAWAKSKTGPGFGR